ncbi:hypothetical protein HPP92_019350 [Vanilla planifolia]|uniref:DCD domain-containing protein n=1 Tax=Vanilla planifolia TaxID=51239 RepID=A0A835Q2Q6_VANPL|nr:hypothetical protein HPP92_019350 [Vanilla planifolia]
MKKNLTAVKESPPSGLGNLDENKKIENNAKQESTVKTVTVGDLMGNEGDSKKDVEVGKKVDEAIKIVKIVKRKKIVGKEKEVSTNSESVPVISATVEASAATTREEKSIETNVTPVVEKVDTDAIKDGANEAEKDEVASNRKPELRMRKKKEAVGSKSLADNPSNADKPSSSAKEKGLVKEDSAEKLKKVDGMGLIFMCNAKTKKDCYRYNIFGLPESKKELVSKVYKGMRLFLFDVDLKLMYGIYKAASPGGYNIQPKAFDSKFPSQVRFTVLKDCLPLPEETFKAAIKENYYRRHKFNCQLSSEQVKKLCNLFQSTSGKSLWLTGADRDVSGRSPRRSLESNRRLPRHKVRVHARERYPSPPRVRYPSPTRRLQLSVVHQAPPPPVSPSYAYERPSDAYYRRDHRGLDVELRSVDPLVDYQDPYALYRDHALYPEPAFPSSLPSAYSARLRPPSPPPRYRY